MLLLRSLRSRPHLLFLFLLALVVVVYINRIAGCWLSSLLEIPSDGPRFLFFFPSSIDTTTGDTSNRSPTSLLLASPSSLSQLLSSLSSPFVARPRRPFAGLYSCFPIYPHSPPFAVFLFCRRRRLCRRPCCLRLLLLPFILFYFLLLFLGFGHIR